MKVFADLDKCEGCGVCSAACPDVYSLDPDGILILLTDSPPEHLQESAAQAADWCPTAAISVSR